MFHEELENVLMSEVARHRVCCPMMAKHPDINRPTGPRILLREPLFRHAHAYALGIAFQMLPYQFNVAERSRH